MNERVSFLSDVNAAVENIAAGYRPGTIALIKQERSQLWHAQKAADAKMGTALQNNDFKAARQALGTYRRIWQLARRLNNEQAA
jgi:hypothetical protein